MKASNKKANYIFIGGIVVLIILLVMLWLQHNEKNELSDQNSKLSEQIVVLEKKAKEKNIDVDIEDAGNLTEAKEEEILITTEQIEQDAELAKEFFSPAFDWESGEQYDDMRERYISLLGEDSSFVESYIVENTKIDTNDGELSFIDHESLKSKFHTLTAIPLEMEGKNRIRYVAFIVHYMHQNKEDLNNLDALNASEAIVEFTIVGDGTSDEREIVDVEAWNLS